MIWIRSDQHHTERMDVWDWCDKTDFVWRGRQLSRVTPTNTYLHWIWYELSIAQESKTFECFRAVETCSHDRARKVDLWSTKYSKSIVFKFFIIIKPDVFEINPVHQVPTYYLVHNSSGNESAVPDRSNHDELFESSAEHRCIARYIGTRVQDFDLETVVNK